MMIDIEKINKTIILTKEYHKYFNSNTTYNFSEAKKEEAISKLENLISILTNNFGETFHLNIKHLLEDRKELNECKKERTIKYTLESYKTALVHTSGDLLSLLSNLEVYLNE
jgi:hypothetical protein